MNRLLLVLMLLCSTVFSCAKACPVGGKWKVTVSLFGGELCGGTMDLDGADDIVHGEADFCGAKGSVSGHIESNILTLKVVQIDGPMDVNAFATPSTIDGTMKNPANGTTLFFNAERLSMRYGKDLDGTCVQYSEAEVCPVSPVLNGSH